MSEPQFLMSEEVLHLHARSLAEQGGSGVTRDAGLLQSALASARNTFHYANGDTFDVAASYVFHLAEAQAFIDGNKRTAVASALVFLAINGFYAQPPTWGLYSAIIDLAEKKRTKADLAATFRLGAAR